jgi:hypothetical protein
MVIHRSLLPRNVSPIYRGNGLFRNLVPDVIAMWVLEKFAHFYRLCACVCSNVTVQIQLFTLLKSLFIKQVFVPVSK